MVDWPNTFGTNMFLYPLSKMTGGIYYEHAHRLFGALVGLTTIGLAVRLWRFDGRPWLRRLAVLAVLADTLRLVSEVMSSNGSTSMASVCASSLALMDAGVPTKGHVSGIAMGLIYEDGKYITLTDILGSEDAFGDMDFKVAGTEDAITALQLDTKIDGIPADVLSDVTQQAYDKAAQSAEAIIEEAAEGDYPVGSDEQKVGALYASYMDMETRNARGVEPLQPHAGGRPRLLRHRVGLHPHDHAPLAHQQQFLACIILRDLCPQLSDTCLQGLFRA